MLRLRQILEATPVAVHRRAARCITRIPKAEIYVDENGSFKFMQGHVVDPPAPGPWPNSRGPYTVIAKLYMDEKKQFVRNPKVWVWCDCEWFKFHCETSLAIRGSSAIINSNGALPKITNPRGRPKVCKHCLAFLRRSLDRKQFLSPKNPTTIQDQKVAQALRDATPPPRTVSNFRTKMPSVIKSKEEKVVRKALSKPTPRQAPKPPPMNLRGHR